MQWKLAVFGITAFLFIGIGSAAQPKIVEMTDNFGHTFSFDVSDSDESASAAVDEQITLTDETNITLCVTKVQKNTGDEISFTYDSFLSNHQGWVDNTCHTWDLDTSDYKSSWWFDAQIKNQDDITFATSSLDFYARIHYRNISLAGEPQGESQVTEYDTVQLSKAEYDRLKDEASEPTPEENQVIVNESVWRQKNERIQELEQQVETLQQTVEQLRNTVQELNQSSTVDEGAKERNTSPQQQQDSRQASGGEQGGFFGAISAIFSFN